ncbi:hypothetical protein [Haliscomenobacter hydrossis]|uniref:Uncharacterized protein n=1 Tax=Haliscomenobacter hydrossis (strain ATCC 27775 / DSM 1100 / LMG 10767 / O) TaxID=760192 RepID=F4L3U6_HALH1|nr:hypothetical protein [Haliscomenobacter hydrossis]AEE48700.1 hypothetical protein Halhy_0793 [Haliscomenobacter hydrossis DSM 1100]
MSKYQLPPAVSERQFDHILSLSEHPNMESFKKAQAVFSHLLSLYVREQQLEGAFMGEEREIYDEGIEFLKSFLILGCM